MDSNLSDMLWYSVVDRSLLCSVGSVGSSWSALSFTGKPSWIGSGGLGGGVGVGGGFLTRRSPRFLVDGFLFSVISSHVRRKMVCRCTVESGKVREGIIEYSNQRGV